MLIKRPILFISLSLLLGALAGASYLMLERYAARELLGLLADEIKASGPYDLSYEDAELSFINLRAEAKNAKIYSIKDPSKKALVLVSKLEADFSIKRISDNIADLLELRLIDANLNGLGPESAIFNVVNYLGAPIDPAKDSPDRFKIKLQKLSLKNSVANDAVAGQDLRISGLALSVARDQRDNFNLQGSIKKAAIFDKQSRILLPIFKLKNIAADLYITDNDLTLNKLNATFPGGQLSSNLRVATSNDDKIDGNFKIEMNQESLDFAELIDGQLKIVSRLAGMFEKPEFSGLLNSESLKLKIPEAEPALQINSLQASFKSVSENNIFSVLLESLSSDPSSTLQIELKKPLTINSKGIDGAIDFKIPSITVGQKKFSNLNATVSISDSMGIQLQASVITPQDLLSENLLIDCRHIKSELDCRLNSQSARLNGRLTVKIPENSIPNIDYGELSFKHSDQVEINTSFSGPADPLLLKAQAVAKLPNSVLINLNLNNGLLEINSPDKSSIKVTGSSDFRHNYLTELKFNADNFNFLSQQDQKNCNNTSFSAELNFKDFNLEAINGFIDLYELQLGCEPFEINLKEKSKIKIESLKANLPAIILSSKYGDVSINGDISAATGYNLSVVGNTSMATMIPFIQEAEELSGELKIDAKISGKISSPVILGYIELEHGIFESSNPHIEASNIKAKASINNRTIEIEFFDGDINNGRLSIQGAFDLEELNNSILKARLENVYLQPIEDSELMISGDLSVISSNPPIIRGQINIDSFELVKKFNFLSSLKNVPFELLGSAPKKISLDNIRGNSNINLDLDIEADDAIFLDSNFAQIEAKTKLKLSGNSAKPEISGEIEVLQGWFGLRDRRFDIGSGKVIFNSQSDIPNLEVLAESSVFTRQGENVVIFASITGPAISPSIKLDSDRGYTEKEILNLLTSGTNINSSRNSISFLPQESDINLPFISDDSFFGFGRWLRRFAKIDSLSVEPSYNPLDGVVEPILVAEKRISPTMYLRGETSFGGSSYNASARLNYSLTQRTTLSGIAESLATQDVSTLGADISYAFKPLKSLLLEININGNFLLTEDSILTYLKLNEDSRITADSLQRLTANLNEFYYNSGFRNYSNSVDCEKYNDKNICEILNLNISEGEKFEYSSIKIVGDKMPEQLRGWEQSVKSASGTATSEFKNKISTELTALLRNEGFIRARVESDYVSNESGNNLILKVKLGSPVSFVFEGNTVFSELELLESINLFKRKQPFGNNTINLLTKNINQLYRQEGYLEAEVSSSDISQDSSRTIYLVSIKEGTKIRLNKVIFEILGELTEAEVKEYLTKYLNEEASSILKPKKLLFEILEGNTLVISNILKSEGYSSNSVEYNLDINHKDSEANLIYQIAVGEAARFNKLSINGLPDIIKYDPPALPVSSFKAEKLRDELNEKLMSSGYYNAKVETSFNQQDSLATINIQSGNQSLISSIRIEGLNSVDQSTVEEKINFKINDPVDMNQLSDLRGRLLRTGLFSKATVTTSDNTFDQNYEDIVIRLEERNLQTAFVGTGLNSEFGLHLFGSLTDRELFSDGRSLSARVDSYLDQLQGSVSQGVISLNYSDPEFISEDIGSVNDLRFQRLDLSSQEYDLDRLSHAFYLHTNFNQNISGTLGHTIKFDDLDDVTAGAILDPEYDTNKVRLGLISSNLLFDYRDNPLNPRRGYAAFITPQLALKAAGSEAEFANIEVKFQKIFDLDGLLDNFDLTYTNRLASAWTLGELDYIPITERFYTGGRTSVRGFRENSLGPIASDGAVIGGDQLIVQSFELRYFVIEEASINLFLDSAKLTLKDYSAEGEDMRYSAGIGSRYLSPIGPIGFDVGFPLDEKSGEPSVRLHFSIGTSF